MIDIHASAFDDTGRFGAVFERDDETAYFYLLDVEKQEGGQIVATVNVNELTELPADTSVSIAWSSSEAAVGLFVGDALSAIFDLRTGAPTGRWAKLEDGSLFSVH